MKNIRFENRLRKMLSESSGREHVKRMLNEALNNDEAACRQSYGSTNWTLACVYGCIPTTGEKRSEIMIPGQSKQTVVVLKAKQPVGEYTKVILTEPNAETGVMTVYMTKENESEFLQSDKQGLKTLWYGNKSCQDLLPNINPQYSAAAKQAITQLQTYFKDTATGKPYLIDWETGNNDPSAIQNGFQPMKLSDFISQYLANKPELANYYKVVEGQRNSPSMVWFKGGAYSEFYGNQSDTARDAWIKNSGRPWKAGKCQAGTESTCTVKNLKDPKDNPYTYKEFTQDVFVHMDNADATGDQILTKLQQASLAVDKNNNKETCKPLLQAYAEAYKLGVQLNPQVVDSYKNQVNTCRSRHNYLLGVNDKLFDNELQVNAVKGKTDYSLGSGATRLQRESYRDRELKNLIRESLLDIKRTKKKINLGENKIINSRIKLISEHRTLKNKIQKDKFFGELMMEMAYLNSQGYDSQLINENFLDMLKGLFGTAADSTLQYFKESIAKWLIGTLTPMDTNGWMANIIIAAVGNVPIGEISRLTECNYLSDVLTKSIVEGAVNKYKNEQGLTGPFYDILRNGVIEMLEDTKFGQVIETAIGDLVCPLLGGIKDKMGSAAETMKKGALSLT
jgi:hypothetical protein